MFRRRAPPGNSLYGKISPDSNAPDYFLSQCSLKGTLFCGGVTSPGDIKDNAKLNEAYEMGKNS